MNIFEDWQDNWKIRFAVWALLIVGVFYFISLALWFWNPGIFDLKFQFWFFAVVTIGFLITWVLTFFIRKEIWKYGTIGVLVLLTVSVAILAGHFSPGEIRNKAKEIAEKSRMTAESRSVSSPTPPKEKEWVSTTGTDSVKIRDLVRTENQLTYNCWSELGRGIRGTATLTKDPSGKFVGTYGQEYPTNIGEIWLEQIGPDLYLGQSRSQSKDQWVPVKLELK